MSSLGVVRDVACSSASPTLLALPGRAALSGCTSAAAAARTPGTRRRRFALSPVDVLERSPFCAVRFPALGMPPHCAKPESKPRLRGWRPLAPHLGPFLFERNSFAAPRVERAP